jgi:hypothetical protein
LKDSRKDGTTFLVGKMFFKDLIILAWSDRYFTAVKYKVPTRCLLTRIFGK